VLLIKICDNILFIVMLLHIKKILKELLLKAVIPLYCMMLVMSGKTTLQSCDQEITFDIITVYIEQKNYLFAENFFDIFFGTFRYLSIKNLNWLI